MSFLGTKITLKGKSQKGKNRVREHGETWFVNAETDRVLFDKSRAGPWLYVVPNGRAHDDKAGRWVHGTADNDFTVMPKED